MKSPTSEMVCFWGPPGSGKSTLLAADAVAFKNAGYKVYTSGVDIKGVSYYDLSLVDRNIWPAAGSILLIDESGLELNNQTVLSDAARQFFKLYRHNADENREMTIFYYSQSYEDTNIVLRRLTVKYFYLRKFWRFTLVYPMLQKPCIKPFVPGAGLFDPNRGYGEVMTGFKFGSVFSRGFRVLYRPVAYAYFNTHVLPKGIKVLDYEEVEDD